MKQRTPQEKKALSYAKDCRNCYGENDKTARVSIRKNKIFPKRAYRKNLNDILHGAIGAVDLEKAEVVDVKAKEIKRRNWKKYPDKQLGEIIKERLEQKAALKKTNNLFQNLVIEVEQETDGRWIAEIDELNGVLVYGETREEAIKKVKALALRVIYEKIDSDNANC